MFHDFSQKNQGEEFQRGKFVWGCPVKPSKNINRALAIWVNSSANILKLSRFQQSAVHLANATYIQYFGLRNLIC